MENNTPPMGEPKATATPAALDAVKSSRILTVHGSQRRIAEGHEKGYSLWLRSYRLNILPTTLPTEQATCTDGPSLPTDNPDAMDSG
jgi:hypothetical protein